MRISARVICIGNEILLGHIANTNAPYISRELSAAGIKTAGHISIPDEPEVIISSIRNALRDSEIVVVSGGLGPTVDDITLGCIAKAVGRKLIFRKNCADHIRAHFKKRRLRMPKNNLRQAFVPEGARPILNNVGSAPGLVIPISSSRHCEASPKRVQSEAISKVLIALPGVPFELYPMFKNTVMPFLKKNFPTGLIIKSRVIKITGLPESRVNEKIEDILRISGNVQMGIYPHPEEISVKITVTESSAKKANAVIAHIEKRIKSRLKDHIFGFDDEKLEEIIGKLLLKKKKTLAIAESCTGGLLGSRITDIPGSSGYFKTGLVLYSNASKNKILGIPLETIKKYGAVSRQVATLMAKNVRGLARTDIGIGLSGIAGPGGASRKKPVGIVYIALSTKTMTLCREFRFLGQRDIIKQKATQAALNFLRNA